MDVGESGDMQLGMQLEHGRWTPTKNLRHNGRKKILNTKLVQLKLSKPN